MKKILSIICLISVYSTFVHAKTEAQVQECKQAIIFQAQNRIWWNLPGSKMMDHDWANAISKTIENTNERLGQAVDEFCRKD